MARSKWWGKDLIGKKFGKLTVIKRIGSTGNKDRLWLCKCNCGGLKEVATGRMTTGHVKSCGCLWKHAKGEANFYKLYRTYQQSAKRRKYPFNLTKGEFRYLTKQKCYYCGTLPNSSADRRASNGAYIYNGIDRLDNNIGYTFDNCVSCCKKCNIMKWDFTIDEFISHISQIYEYNNLEEGSSS